METKQVIARNGNVFALAIYIDGQINCFRFVGGEHGDHEIRFFTEDDWNRAENHWEGYQHNNGYTPGKLPIPVVINQELEVKVGRNKRHAKVIAVLKSKALVEYFTPGGAPCLLQIDRMSKKPLGGVKHSHIPAYWQRAINHAA